MHLLVLSNLALVLVQLAFEQPRLVVRLAHVAAELSVLPLVVFYEAFDVVLLLVKVLLTML